MCTHRFDDDGLPCTNAAEHLPGHGCVYQSGSGSEVPDRHDATSGGEH